jgi:hypothetical protein
MNFFDKKVLEKLWWYGLNIITTLFIISFVNFNAPQGEPGTPGSNGTNGVDGQDGQNGQDFSGQNLYPVSALEYEAAPVGDARAAYAAELVEQGFIPLDSVEDFEIFSVSPNGSFENGFYGNEDAYDDNYVLTADIDFSGEDFGSHGRRIAGFITNEFESSRVGYSGIFDGAGYTISNFTLEVGEYNYDVGFIPTTFKSIIRNINFENHAVKAVLFDGDAGGLIGEVDGRTLIQNVNMTNLEVVSDVNAGGFVGRGNDALYVLNSNVNLGSVYASQSAGGFIGYTDGNYTVFIQDSVNRATIDVTVSPDYYIDVLTIDNVGGFIGEIEDNESTIILNSINDGLLRGDNEAGGFIGLVTFSETLVIANSYNNGKIYSTGSSEAAGFIADLDSPFAAYIQNSYNTAQIYGTNNIGGLVGELGDDFDGDLPDYDYAPLYITNAYNSGTIMTSTGEAAGILAEINNERHVIIQNSFNVGQFSQSVGLNELGEIFRENGAIVGDATGTQLLENVTYYVDLSNPNVYLPHAVDAHLDVGATQLNDIAYFTEDDFYYSAIWNFDSIWTFSDDNYPYPVLQDLNVFNVQPIDEEWLPSIQTVDLWYYEENFNEETNENELLILGLYVEVSDIDSSTEEMTIELYISLDNEYDNATAIVETAQLIYDTTGFEIDIWDQVDPIYVFPNAGSGTYYVYVVVTDADGNQAFLLSENSLEYTEYVADTIAPVPGSEGALTAEIVNFPRDLRFNFTLATDNVSTQDELIYYVVVAAAGFDFGTWDLNWNNPSILFTNQLFNITSSPLDFSTDFDLEINVTYEVTLFVQDAALNLSMYTQTQVAYLD